jgi:arylsulfatase A-like enzyme
MYTMPKIFKKSHYKTAVIGKWHLGIGKRGTPVDWNGDVKPGPLELGFDYSFLLPSTNDRVPCVYLVDHKVLNLDPKDPLYVQRKKPQGFKGTVYPDGKKDPSAMTYYKSTAGHNNSVINGIGRIGYMWGGKSALWNDETMTDVFVDQAKKYIAQFKNKKDQPFFLYFASQCIHVPRSPSPRFRGKSKLSYRGDSMVEFDWAAGEIIKALEKNGLSDNTIVIFSSDNGPVYDDGYADGTTVPTSIREVDRGHDASGPYRGGKYQIYEGGTRVPLMIKWPAKIKPGVSTALVNQIDFMASFAKLIGVELTDEQAIDSRETLSAFLGEDKKGLPYMVEEARGLALRQGPWKYIQPVGKRGKPQLYNLKSDIGEKNNIVKEHAERAQSMDEILTKIKKTDAGIRSFK